MTRLMYQLRLPDGEMHPEGYELACSLLGTPIALDGRMYRLGPLCARTRPEMAAAVQLRRYQ